MSMPVAFKPILEAAAAALELAKAVEVTDMASAETSKSKAVELKNIEKRIEDIRKDLVKPLNDKVSEINKFAKLLSAPITGAKDELARKLIKWQNEERIKAEERAEAERKQREAEAAALAADDNASFEDIEIAQEKVEMAARPVKMTKAETPLQVRETWKFRVTDVKALAKYAIENDMLWLIQPNESDIGKRVRAKENPIRSLPGVEIYSEDTAVVR